MLIKWNNHYLVTYIVVFPKDIVDQLVHKQHQSLKQQEYLQSFQQIFLNKLLLIVLDKHLIQMINNKLIDLLYYLILYN